MLDYDVRWLFKRTARRPKIPLDSHKMNQVDAPHLGGYLILRHADEYCDVFVLEHCMSDLMAIL